MPYTSRVLTTEGWHNNFATETDFKARLSGHRSTRHGDRDDRPRSKRFSKTNLQNLNQAIRHSKYLIPDVPLIWIDRVRQGDEASLVNILLIVLPKLVSLNIQRLGDDHEVFHRFINSILRSGQSIVFPTEVLSNLTSVDLSDTLAQGNKCCWETFGALFHLPSVMSLKAHKFKDSDEYGRQKLRQLSYITDLDVLDCALDQERLIEVMSRFHWLDFSY